MCHCHACNDSSIYAYLLNEAANTAKTPKPYGYNENHPAKIQPKSVKIALAKTLWNECYPIAGTHVETYLHHRRLIKPDTVLPDCLRYHPQLKHPEGGNYPAMVASVTNWQGEPYAIHRTYLQPDGRGKATITPAKMSLGDLTGNSVHLSPCGQSIGLCEGIETGLAIQTMWDEPVWACLSTAGLINIQLPPLPLAETVFIFADNDTNHAGKIAADTLAQRLHFEGRSVVFCMPDTIGHDFADDLYNR